MKNQTTQPATAIHFAIMPATTLRGLIDQAINTDKAHTLSYAKITAALREGIATKLVSDAANKEYKRRLDVFCKGLAKARDVDPDSIARAVRRYNVAAAWIAPREEKSADEVAVAARKKEADKKSEQRAVKRVLVDLKKEKPEAGAKDLRVMAKQLVKETTKKERDAARDNAKTAANEDKFISQLAAFKVKMSEIFVADCREAQLGLAAVITALKDIQTKA